MDQYKGMELVGKLKDKDLTKISLYQSEVVKSKETFIKLSYDEVKLDEMCDDGFDSIKNSISEKEFDEAIAAFDKNDGVKELPQKTREMFGKLMFIALQVAGIRYAKKRCYGDITKFENKKKKFAQNMFKHYKLNKEKEYTVDFVTGNIYMKPDIKKPDKPNNIAGRG